MNAIMKISTNDFLSDYLQMLHELEDRAVADNDAVLYVHVERWYRQYNAMTGENKNPRWLQVPS